MFNGTKENTNIIDNDENMENLEMQDKDYNLEETDKGTKVEDPFPELDFSKVQGANFETNSAIGNREEASEIRIVNTREHGRRIVLKESLIDKIGSPKQLEFGFLEDTLIISSGGSKRISEVSYNIKKQSKSTYCIYNSNLVEEITKRLELDFSNVSTVNLTYITYKEVETNETIVMARA